MLDDILEAIARADEDACVIAALVLEQARGRDVRALLVELGAGALAGTVIQASERRALIEALLALAREDSPPVAVVFALTATADPLALRPLLDRLATELKARPSGVLAEQLLRALLSIEWPEAAIAARLAAQFGDGDVRDEAVAWLRLYDNSHNQSE